MITYENVVEGTCVTIHVVAEWNMLFEVTMVLNKHNTECTQYYVNYYKAI